MSFGLSKVVGWIYTVLVVAAAAWASRRALREEERPVLWLSILVLATLRSPFLPQAYAAIPPLWLLTLLVAHQQPTPRTMGLFFLGWMALNVYWPHDSPLLDPRMKALLNGIPQTATIVVASLGLWFRAQAAASGAGRITTGARRDRDLSSAASPC